jgi:hypothetical protein
MPYCAGIGGCICCYMRKEQELWAADNCAFNTIRFVDIYISCLQEGIAGDYYSDNHYSLLYSLHGCLFNKSIEAHQNFVAGGWTMTAFIKRYIFILVSSLTVLIFTAGMVFLNSVKDNGSFYIEKTSGDESVLKDLNKRHTA